MDTSPVPAMNDNWSQVPSAPNPTNRTFPVAVTADGPFPFSGDLMSTFSQTTFIIRSSPWRTSNVGSPSPTRRMIRNLVAAGGAAGAAAGRVEIVSGCGRLDGGGPASGWIDSGGTGGPPWTGGGVAGTKLIAGGASVAGGAGLTVIPAAP